MEVRQVFAQEENPLFSILCEIPPSELTYSEVIYHFSLFWTARGYVTNTRNVFVSLGLREDFDHGVSAFLLAIAVVQVDLVSWRTSLSPNNKSVIAFTFVFGCVWCIICKTVAQVSEQWRTRRHHLCVLPMWLMVMLFTHQISCCFCRLVGWCNKLCHSAIFGLFQTVCLGFMWEEISPTPQSSLCQ